MGAYRNERDRRLRRPTRGADGHCKHPASLPRLGGPLETRLVGRRLPDVQLQYAQDAFVKLPVLARRWSLAIFFYPGNEKTTTPGDDQTVGIDERRAVAWMRCEPELARLGYEVIGVSAQSAIEQARFASRDPLPYMLLSDPTLKLAAIMGLPTACSESARAYEPLAIVVRNQSIVRVFHPIDPECEAASVTRWIRNNAVQ